MEGDYNFLNVYKCCTNAGTVHNVCLISQKFSTTDQVNIKELRSLRSLFL